MINIFQPELRTEELEAVRQVFESNWTGKGQITDQFESRFASYLGVDRSLIRSISCCTEGLFQAMSLLQIRPGDEVILPSISFVGAANAIASAKAVPVFCDVDLRTLNVTADTIAKAITSKTKAIIILHYGGRPCEMDEISKLLAENAIALIEDNACSIASQYKGSYCGTLGDVGVWSFDSMKILVTGDGGMIYCKNMELAQNAEELTYLGLVTKSGFASKVDNKWWAFEISSFGRRAIMNDITSAIGLEQLKKLPNFINRRRQIHQRYTTNLGNLPWLSLPPDLPTYMNSSYYFYWLQLPLLSLRDKLSVHLKENGIYSTFRYYPLHLVKYYNSHSNLALAERAAEITLCIPIHHSLSDEDVDKIIDTIQRFSKLL